MWAAGGTFDRAEDRRDDPGWPAAQWAAPAALALRVDAGGRVAWADGLDLTAPSGEFDPERCWLLGIAGDGSPRFAVLDEVASGRTLRELPPDVTRDDLELVTAAAALAGWHASARFCGFCGAESHVTGGGFVRRCRGCGRDAFPRTDPAVIVAVVDAAGRLLLGRQGTWPSGRMSLLAGFVAAGESLEQAVRREVAEESGVRVAAVRYLASQPWPFPRSLMLGYTARAATTEIVVDGVEIVDARWFTPDEMTDELDAGRVSLPMPVSIAYRIIDAWRTGRLPAPEQG